MRIIGLYLSYSGLPVYIWNAIQVILVIRSTLVCKVWWNNFSPKNYFVSSYY